MIDLARTLKRKLGAAQRKVAQQALKPFRSKPENCFLQAKTRLLEAPGMIEESERKLLFLSGYEAGSKNIVEFGAFFGASTLALASGMLANNQSNSKIICIDAFEVSKSHSFYKHVVDFCEANNLLDLLKFTGDKAQWLDITRKVIGPDVLENVELISSLVDENFTEESLPAKIELLHLDMPKDINTITPIVKLAFPRLQKGSKILFQDFGYHFSNELISFFQILEEELILEKKAIAASTVKYEVLSDNLGSINWQNKLDEAKSEQSKLIRAAAESYKKTHGSRKQEIVAIIGAEINYYARNQSISDFEKQRIINALLEEALKIDKSRMAFVVAELLTDQFKPHS